MPTPFYNPKIVLWLVFIFCFGSTAISQKNFIRGAVRDTAEKINLHYSIVALVNLFDSTLTTSVRTNELGQFEITKIAAGKYLLMVSHPRMADFLKELIIKDTSKIDIGKVDMVTEAVLLQEVIVKANLPVRMRGDTLEYTADSFAVRPGANVEELLKRLPGIQVEQNGKIIAQGQEVKKILVDGDEFFSDDPGLATKYLNADAIDKVQVFDKKSEQAEFTGIDDGSKTKTINLKLKKNKKNGSFGKVSASSNGKEYYNYDAMGALFNGAKKMAVFGLATKTGKAGLSNSEVTKYVAQDYEMIDDGTGNVYFTNNNNDYESDSYSGNGLPTVLYGGAHYSNKWNDSHEKLYSNYRTKQIDATGWTSSKGTTVLPDGTSFFSQSNSTEKTHSYEQKASGTFTIAVDSFSTIKASVNSRLTNGNRSNATYSDSRNEKGFMVNTSNHNTSSFYNNNTFGSNINFQHKFRKLGRTLSLVLQQNYNDKNNGSYNYTANVYFDPASGTLKNTDTLDQLQNSKTLLNTFATKAVYTDRFSKAFGISFEYGFKTASETNTFSTFNKNNSKYNELVDTLSSDYNFLVKTHIAGTAFSFNTKKVNVSLGGKMYLTGFRQLNNTLKNETDRSFTNFAPQLNTTVRLKENSSLTISYSGQTRQPSVEQLQPFRRSSNPLYVQIGNPDLQQSFLHDASLSYYMFNWAKGTNLSAYLSANYTDNNITTKTTTDAQNRTISQYINLDGIAGFNGSVNYGKEYKKIHLRPSIGLSTSRYGNYSILNNETLKNENISANVNIGCGYDLINKLSISYRGYINYNIGTSSIKGNTVNRTMSHTHTINSQFYLPKKFEIGSDATFNFQPKNSTFNTNFNTVKWNGYVQKKFMKNDVAFVKLSVNDILNSNTGYNRSVYGNNVYETDKFVIKRYWLLTLGWNFNKSIK